MHNSFTKFKCLSYYFFMEKDKLSSLAKAILRSNIYMTLATCDKKPWASPVYYAMDRKYNFYYISQLKSVHSKNILKNGYVSFAIFDSHQKEGTGNGVQGYGTARLMKDSELKIAFETYNTTFLAMEPKSFTGKALYRFFKIIPKSIYIQDPKSKIDKRIEINLQ